MWCTKISPDFAKRYILSAKASRRKARNFSIFYFMRRSCIKKIFIEKCFSNLFHSEALEIFKTRKEWFARIFFSERKLKKILFKSLNFKNTKNSSFFFSLSKLIFWEIKLWFDRFLIEVNYLDKIIWDEQNIFLTEPSRFY